ncbi:hypothetical protein [uncultured Microbacterium sp.]|uniref:hypothetical protein n=1 Tax=uncultured Microbacterium sp. TaxID=191216 RepID=UPI0025DA8819|nr:hypothetical protein [uncultured Microbacterium sp.]
MSSSVSSALVNLSSLIQTGIARTGVVDAFNPTPSPSVSTPPPELVTPGVFGFGGVAIIVAAVALLVWDMQRRIRRARYRDEVRAELDAEEAAARDAQTTDALDGAAQIKEAQKKDAQEKTGDEPQA